MLFLPLCLISQLRSMDLMSVSYNDFVGVCCVMCDVLICVCCNVLLCLCFVFVVIFACIFVAFCLTMHSCIPFVFACIDGILFHLVFQK